MKVAEVLWRRLSGADGSGGVGRDGAPVGERGRGRDVGASGEGDWERDVGLEAMHGGQMDVSGEGRMVKAVGEAPSGQGRSVGDGKFHPGGWRV